MLDLGSSTPPPRCLFTIVHNTNMSTSADLVVKGNKEFYALTAAEYDKMGRGMVVNVARDNATNMLERVPGMKQGDIMDFAAGTGLLAMFLAPHCRSVTAVDQSKEMIAQLQSKLHQQQSQDSITNITPLVTDLLTDQDASSPLHGKRFDVIACTNSFHHFSDPAQMTRALAVYLKPGGHFAITDLLKTATSAQFHEAPATEHREDGTHKQVWDESQDDGPRHAHHHSHQHKHDHVIAQKGGFSREDMVNIFASADVELIDMQKSTEFEKGGKVYDVFLAIGKKRAS